MLERGHRLAFAGMHRLAEELAGPRMAADSTSRKRFRRARRADAPSAEPIEVAIRQLDGERVWLRPGTTDAIVAMAAFLGRYHRPPADSEPPSSIWDLGCNIGLTMRDMAHAYPDARIIGVDLDPANVAMARRNLEQCGDRCRVIEGGVWPDPGTIEYADEGRADGFRIAGSGGGRTASAVTPTELLERFGPPDFVKLDIEGAEEPVLARAGEWASEVQLISVECHPPYSLDRCRHDLESLGFRVADSRRQSLRQLNRDYVIGRRL